LLALSGIGIGAAFPVPELPFPEIEYYSGRRDSKKAYLGGDLFPASGKMDEMTNEIRNPIYNPQSAPTNRALFYSRIACLYLALRAGFRMGEPALTKPAGHQGDLRCRGPKSLSDHLGAPGSQKQTKTKNTYICKNLMNYTQNRIKEFKQRRLRMSDT
jgi:hypothetical protein